MAKVIQPDGLKIVLLKNLLKLLRRRRNIKAITQIAGKYSVGFRPVSTELQAVFCLLFFVLTEHLNNFIR